MFKLVTVTGIADAILALKFSKRNYTESISADIRALVDKCTERNGFVHCDCNGGAPALYDEYVKQLNTVAKWGAGVGVSADLDAGHETILRFIDLTVEVKGLHYAGMADLDSHAMRMNNRIVRSSSRLTTKGSTELSDWYADKIVPFSHFISDIWWMNDEAKSHSEALFPDEIESITGDIYTKTPSGYVRADLVDDKDALRGLYPLGMSSDCIFKIGFHDMRHVYMRRGARTHAAPELQQGIEMLADQIEAAIPGDLGKLIRNDYCYDGKLHHVGDITKTYTPAPKTE